MISFCNFYWYQLIELFSTLSDLNKNDSFYVLLREKCPKLPSVYSLFEISVNYMWQIQNAFLYISVVLPVNKTNISGVARWANIIYFVLLCRLKVSIHPINYTDCSDTWKHIWIRREVYSKTPFLNFKINLCFIQYYSHLEILNVQNLTRPHSRHHYVVTERVVGNMT